jgi:transcription initiation factor TFIID subunit 8
MKTQFTYFKNVKKVLSQKLGDEETTNLLARAVYLISISSNDCSVSNDCSDPRKDKFKQARQRRKADRSLLNLQKRLFLCNGNPNRTKSTETTSTRSDPGEDVAPVVLPVKLPIVDGDQVSVFQAFAPAIKKLGGGSVLCDDDDDGIAEKTRLFPLLLQEDLLCISSSNLGRSSSGSLWMIEIRRGMLCTQYFWLVEKMKKMMRNGGLSIFLDTLENPQELTLL